MLWVRAADERRRGSWPSSTRSEAPGGTEQLVKRERERLMNLVRSGALVVKREAALRVVSL